MCHSSHRLLASRSAARLRGGVGAVQPYVEREGSCSVHREAGRQRSLQSVEAGV